MYNDIPSEDPCNLVNPPLWKHFNSCYSEIWKIRPASDWSEAEVVQWLDTRYPYLHTYINNHANKSLNGG